MSKRSKQKRAAGVTPAQRYRRDVHGQGLVDFMQAFDSDDLSDGAWQAMLEDGGDAYAETFGVKISGYDAFMEYVELRGQA